MKLKLLAIVVLLLQLSFVFGEFDEKKDEIESDESIRSLTLENFDELLDVTKEWFIMFYMPSCPHCNNLYKTVKGLVYEISKDVTVAKVNAAVDQDLARLFEVIDVPFLYHIKDGVARKFEKKRTEVAMIDFITEQYQTVDPFDLVANLKDRKARKDITKTEQMFEKTEKHIESKVVSLSIFNSEEIDSGTWLILIFAPWCAHSKKIFPIWTELSLSDKIGDTRVGVLNGEDFRDLASRFETLGYPSVVFVKDKIVYKYGGNRTLEDFIDFANSGYRSRPSTPLPFVGASFVYNIDSTNSTALLTGEWLVLLYAPWCGHCKNIQPTWDALSVADELGSVKVAKINTDANQELGVLFAASSFPTIYRYSNGKVYSFQESDRTYQTILDFAVKKYLNNKPESKLFGPSSIPRRLISEYLRIIIKFMSYLGHYGISQEMFIFGLIGSSVLLLIILILAAICCSPKQKPTSSEIEIDPDYEARFEEVITGKMFKKDEAKTTKTKSKKEGEDLQRRKKDTEKEKEKEKEKETDNKQKQQQKETKKTK